MGAFAGEIPQTEEFNLHETRNVVERFCKEFSDQCESKPGSIPVDLAVLKTVNDHVNQMVIPRTDFEIWGVADRWSLPALDQEGQATEDCDGIALLKRAILEKEGYPSSQLRLAFVGIPEELMSSVARTRYGDDSPERFQYQGVYHFGHVVLVVKGEGQDWVLDEADPMPWEEYVSGGRWIIAIQDGNTFTKFWSSFYPGRPGYEAYRAHLAQLTE